MRRLAILILACTITAGCGLMPTSQGLSSGKASTVKAKDVWMDRSDGYQRIFNFLSDRFTDRDSAGPYDTLPIRFAPAYRNGLHVTTEASASLQPIANEDGEVSAYDLAMLIANGKMQIEDADPKNPNNNNGYWLSMGSDNRPSGSFELLRQQRDYYASNPRNNWSDLEKVAMLDKKLIEVAYAEAQNGDTECSLLLEMRTYYTARYADPDNRANKAPNDGKDSYYHHDQVLLICKYVLEIGIANADFNVLTELRDFFEQSPDNVFPNRNERVQKINEVNSAILKLFGFDGLSRSRRSL